MDCKYLQHETQTPITVLTQSFLLLLPSLFLYITYFFVSPNPPATKTYGLLLTKSQSSSWVLFLFSSRSLFVSFTFLFSSICLPLGESPLLLCGRHTGKPSGPLRRQGQLVWLWEENGTGSQEAWVSALTLWLANNVILEEILFPTGNMRAMDPMLSEVYSSTNHLLHNYSMDDVLKDIVPPSAHNLLGTKIILKFECV